MPSIIFCYRILFGLQRKVSLGGGEKHFDERQSRPLFTQRAPPSFWSPRGLVSDRCGPRGLGIEVLRSTVLLEVPELTHAILRLKLFTRLLG